ncbi:hypothetical protein GLOIN_2v1762669 [Rhizophagus irregularis DAOM 181602=DAOM 197198]|nr:hypothetical protein GLOIN_2v1762669 [Rhizophagus irregularis DAOM 181602=DAOM 197198]
MESRKKLANAVRQIQTIVDYFSKNPNTELPDDQEGRMMATPIQSMMTQIPMILKKRCQMIRVMMDMMDMVDIMNRVNVIEVITIVMEDMKGRNFVMWNRSPEMRRRYSCRGNVWLIQIRKR